MYTIIVKYYSYKDKEIHIEEVRNQSISGAIHTFLSNKEYSIIVLSASYKDECAVIKDSINEE